MEKAATAAAGQKNHKQFELEVKVAVHVNRLTIQAWQQQQQLKQGVTLEQQVAPVVLALGTPTGACAPQQVQCYTSRTSRAHLPKHSWL